MAYANNKISVIVEEQLPGFIRDDHNNFVQFVKSYYEFLELQHPPIDVSLVVTNPSESFYTALNPYAAGPYIVAETIQQFADEVDPTIVTAEASVFAYTANTTHASVTVTDIGGTTGEFVRRKEIVGVDSGVIYWPSEDVKEAKPGALQASSDMVNIRDIDRSTAQYLEFIQREVSSGFPTNFADGIDKRTALKNLRDFYHSKGTENSFRLLFRLVYGEDIELYLPSEDLLRPSVGEWEQRTTLRLSVPTTDALTNVSRDVSDIIGKGVFGLASRATAIIERAQTIVYSGSAFVEAEISSKVGVFDANETVKIAYVDAVTNSPVTINLTNYGLISSIAVTDGGSNYAIGDRISVSGGNGIGTIAEVSEVNDTTGAVTEVTIIDPGYRYTSLPTTLNLDGPHSGDLGDTRFSAGPLETLVDANFNLLEAANGFFSESDNRGSFANTGAIGSDLYDINDSFVRNSAEVDANSYSNFVTTPGIEDGLNAWWTFDSYQNAPITHINTKDGTFGDGNDPSANVVIDGFWGPRVGDSKYQADPSVPAFGYGNLNTLNNRPTNAQNALPIGIGNDDTALISSNTYSPDGWVGFKPVVIDKSGQGRHAWLQTVDTLAAAAGFTGRANVFSRGAFSQKGIFGETAQRANSWVNGPDTTDQESLGGIVLRSHDDLRNANTQTWVMWYYPYGEAGYFGGTHNNDTAWVTFPSTSGSYNSTLAPNIISRDAGAYWALQANVTSTIAVDYHDVIFTFPGATYDNGNPVSGQVANTSGLFPGHIAGTLNAGGGSLRAQTWNMITLSIDHTAGVGNLYFFNTTDGFHSSNGFSIPVTQDANTTSGGDWPALDGLTQGRAVVLGSASASANGDSNGTEQNPASSAHGRYDEVRYYDKALNAQQIGHLFKNPGGRFDNTLSGQWAIVNPAVSGNTAVEFVYDVGEESQVVRIGSDDSSTGLQLVYNKDIPFDPYSHYKITVKAKDTTATNAANVQFGVIGVANTGTSLIGYSGGDDWNEIHAIVQSPFGNNPTESGSLGEAWSELSAVFGGNTAQPGWAESFPTTDTYSGTGGNTAQDNSETSTFTWLNPAKLFGSDTIGVQQGTGNTTFFRPVLRWDSWGTNDYTDIDFVKIEASRPAQLVATLGGEFVWPGSSIGDAGKLSTSATGLWTPKFLGDNNFYQTYSYVIRSGFSINVYKDLVQRLVHTTGKKLFGEVDIVSVVSVSPNTQAFNEAVLSLFVEYYGGVESLLLGEDQTWNGRSLKGQVAVKSDFGLYDIPDLPFDLDLAHGEFDILDYYEDAFDLDPQDLIEDFTGSKTTTTITTSNPQFIGDNIVRFDNTSSTTQAADGNLGWRIVRGSLVGPNLTVSPDPARFHFPYIQTNGSNNNYMFDVDGNLYPKLQMKIKRVSGTQDAAWTGTMFWGRADGPDTNNSGDITPSDYPYGSQDGLNYSKKAKRPAVWGSDFHIIEWDFVNDPRWDGKTITELRFDFDRLATVGTPTDNIYEIEYIKFVGADEYTYGSPDGPAWIAWDQSPADNPYANGHYSATLYPDPSYLSSNAATRPTKTSLIWECNGALAKLVTGYEDVSECILALDGHNDATDNNDGVNWQNRQGLPLNVTPSEGRYVRMKVRRVGPGGYGINDWLGACQAETITVSGGSYNQPVPSGTNIGANTISQPGTLVIPAGSDPDTKSPWHILEWDMHDVGAGTVGANTISRDIFSTNNIGWVGITLVSNPTENEKFEIDWIQLDAGTHYPRGSFIYPAGRTDQVDELIGDRNQFSDGAGVGGHKNTVQVNSSHDYSTRNIGNFSVTGDVPVDSEIKFASFGANNATVIYVATGYSKKFNLAGAETLEPATGESHIFRVSANTANSTDWMIADQVHANTDFNRYSIFTDKTDTQNWNGPITFELDENDTIFAGYLYAEDQGSFPGTSNFATPADATSADSRPFFMYHYQPTANIAPSGVVGGNTGHNFYGVSNTFINELVVYGNTAVGGVSILGSGPRGRDEGRSNGGLFDDRALNSVGSFLDDRGALHIAAKDSHNITKIVPARGMSRDGSSDYLLPLILGEDPHALDVPYFDGLTTVNLGPDRLPETGVQTSELANIDSYDSNGMVLGTWDPHHIVKGPKGSFFVACNNYNTALGSNSIYCYQVVPTQNVSTGVWVVANVYPVFANTSHTTDVWQGCTGMAIDNLDPPNFYYATANTIHKIEPKGYSYEIGDTTSTQLINETAGFWDTNHATGFVWPPLGKYNPNLTTTPATFTPVNDPWAMESNYTGIEVDRYNRLFIAGRANVYVYDTNTDTLSVAYSPQEYQSTVDIEYSLGTNYDSMTVADFDVEPDTGELAVLLVGLALADANACVVSVRPNPDLSYDTSAGGQLGQLLITPDVDSNTRFFTPPPTFPGGLIFKSNVSGKIKIRKKKP